MNIHIKYTFILLLFGVSLVGCLQKKTDPYAWVKTLPDPWRLSELDFAKFLPKFQKKYPDFHNRLMAINLWRVGTPYRAFCLGEEDGKDPDPIIRVDSSDCTIHILTSIAFTESNSWKEARDSMVKLHYKPVKDKEPKPTYRSRWHFTSDRVYNHPRTPNITANIALKESLKFVDVNLNMKKDGTEFLELDWNSNEKIGYIPTKNISSEITENLPPVCGVAFVKETYFKMGVVIAHEGFILNKRDLVHASSDKKKTVNTDFLTYLNKDGKPRFDGVIFYKINQD